jgi:transcription-repair coupling factor (superfamily II helicase)
LPGQTDNQAPPDSQRFGYLCVSIAYGEVDLKLEELVQLYFADKRTAEIARALQSPSCLHLKGLAGSSRSMIVKAVFEASHQTQLFILDDKEEAAYFLNDLENLHGKSNVLFFPSSNKLPYDVETTDNANILLRTEVLNKILQASRNTHTPFLIVTYPEAISEKVVTRAQLGKNTLELKQHEKLSIDFIIEVMNSYGFERKDYVIEPGQFSVRGGIVDIWSFSNDFPYRVEFFGDEVESIRTFDPVSQLSISNFVKASIIPNVQDNLFRENRQSFLEYLPPGTPLWFSNYSNASDKIGKAFEKAENIYASLDGLLDHLKPEELFLDKNTCAELTSRMPMVEWGMYFSREPDNTITYHFTPQPVFNKNFDLLIGHMKENTQNGYRNIIFSDTAKQMERLRAIFEDIGKGIDFYPVNVSIHEGFVDRDLKVACFTDHQIFERYHKYQLKNSVYQKKEALTLKELKELKPGDFVTHIDHGIGRFGGLEKVEVNGKSQETIRIVYKDNDVLNISIHALHRVAKYSGKEGGIPRIDKLGSNAWSNLKQKTKRKVIEIAFDLIQLYAKRKAKDGFQFSPDNYLQNELEASFIYEDTPDQVKSTADVKRDMEKPYPMDRLICGDVGFGKTEVAIRAAFKAACDGKQVAVLVPTTILALQHYKTFKERLKGLPVTVDYINRFRTAKQQKETLANLVTGKVDILIGTHKLVGKEVKFKDLGLLIIDEEQKFGVGVKDKLKTLKVNVDALTLTATPIPRTLQFSMMGARDLSVITTPPPNRYPVQTSLQVFEEEVIRDGIMNEVQRGGQVFFVHNRVSSLNEIAGLIQRLCPGVRVATGHGQMDGDKLEEVMLGFVEGDYDVLVSTTIIESGLDISNANTIFINEAHMFGLSDLHQMRGRVGRSNKKAFCYLLTPPMSVLTDEARKRLKAIEEFSELGSGFHIAMRDLDIRGAGNLLGGEQSGFINDIGFDTYQKILDEAVQELKETTFKGLFDENEDSFTHKRKAKKGTTQYVRDTQVDTDLEILLPETYVNNITERLSLYRELDELNTDEELYLFESKLRDRFGPVPGPALELIDTIRLRRMAMEIGLERLMLKNGKMVGFFIPDQKSPYYQSEIFSKVLYFVQHNPRLARMKEGNNKLTLTFEHITGVKEAIHVLSAVIPKLENEVQQ